MSQPKVFVLGAGFIGKPLALQLKQSGYDVSVSVRNIENAKKLLPDGISVHAFSVGDVLQLEDSFSCDTLVICYPIGSRSQPAASHLKQADWLSKHFPISSLKQVILTSSTSVYPDGFGLVDENFKTPPTDHGLVQWEYEQALQKIYGSKLTVFRLAGLIGAHRQPGRFLAGKVNLPNPNSPVNLVHQADVIRFLLTAIDQGVVGEVFNLCHNNHPTRAEYYTNAALTLELIPPIFSTEQIKNPKIVDNTKSKVFFGLDYLSPIG
jgi:nucleoside-diphosphate-sugar epimerase